MADVPAHTMVEIAERVRAARVELDWSEFDAAQQEKQAIRERTKRRIARINSGTLRGRLLTIFTR
ncbi:MAG TPA: hypothetical protein VF158_11155 [Longimicrobiales bacterium]